MSTDRDLNDPLQVAAAKALRAHQVLGVMHGCTSAAEMTDAVADFLAAARSATQTLARLGESADDSAFAQWVGERLLALRAHPVEAELAASTRPTIGRTARGTDPPFHFEGFDNRPAIDLCSEYLQYLTLLVDESRSRLKR